jgi:hypothetical protein
MTAHTFALGPFVALCPRTGVHLRPATAEEEGAYRAQERRPPFDRPVRVGDVIIDLDSGPGLSHTPGRFL